MRLKKRHWTAEDDRKLLELRASGRLSRSIAAALGRSTAAVDRRLATLKVRTQSGNEETSYDRIERVGEKVADVENDRKRCNHVGTCYALACVLTAGKTSDEIS